MGEVSILLWDATESEEELLRQCRRWGIDMSYPLAARATGRRVERLIEVLLMNYAIIFGMQISKSLARFLVRKQVLSISQRVLRLHY